MQEDLNDLSSKLYNAMFNVDAAISYSEIIGYLEKIREKLRSDYHDLYLDELNQLMDKVHIFKTHFATLDIRQDHSKHLLVVESVLKKEGIIKESINELKEQELVKLLLEKNFQLNPKDFEDDIVKDTIVNIKNLKSIQEKK